MKDFLDELDNELNSMVKVSPQNSQDKYSEKTSQNTSQEEKVETKISQKQNFNPKNHQEAQKKPIQKNMHQKTPSVKIESGTGVKTQKGEKKPLQAIPRNPKIREKLPTMKGKQVHFPYIKFYLPKLRDDYTRFIPIGGNDETGGKNCAMFQYGDDIIIVDAGLNFPDPDMHGIDYSIPDVGFLTKYTKNIKGLFITHAHLDHIGSIKNILPALDFPVIYGTKLTLGIIRKGLAEYKMLDKCTLIEVDAKNRETVKAGAFDVQFISVNHSVPDCAGLYITSPSGVSFFHTGDFKFDFTPRLDKPADVEAYKAIGEKGVTMMFSDSTGSIKEGDSASEKLVGEALENIVREHHSGKLIIATFSSWISRVQQLIDICEKYDKYIFLSGRSMVENITIAKELGYITAPKGRIKKMTKKNTESVPDYQQVVITTGSQGEEYASLTRMGDGKHNNIDIVAGDTVVFSSSVVPGNEMSVVNSINKLIKLGAKVITKDDAFVHTGGHGQRGDQRRMYEFIKPKFFTPVHGDLYFRTRHSENIIAAGHDPKNIIMVNNGNILDIAPDETIFRSKIFVPIQKILIDGKGIGTADSQVLEAREKLKNAGVVTLGLRFDKKTKALIGKIKLETRGLVYPDEVRNVHKSILKRVKDSCEYLVKTGGVFDEKTIEKKIRMDLESHIYKLLEREPMIIIISNII